MWSVEIKHQGITTMHSHVKDVKVNPIIYCIFGADFTYKAFFGMLKLFVGLGTVNRYLMVPFGSAHGSRISMEHRY